MLDGTGIHVANELGEPWATYLPAARCGNAPEDRGIPGPCQQYAGLLLHILGLEEEHSGRAPSPRRQDFP